VSSHLPFSSVVGQEEAKLALLLAAVEPRLGGVLLRGDKGSAKTTLARGLAAVLPAGAPFVELPLGAGEDRVLGSLDVTALLRSREHGFRPGLLAEADGGVLYVDEVNLLPDHLVDVLLDVAVSGVNRVERDGFSRSHPARFVLVGSMNPEEGELRPQLLDRFGLAVEVRAPASPELRAEIVRRQLAFEAGEVPDRAAEDVLREALASARPAPCGEEVVLAAAELAVAVGAEGLRADLALCRAAGALAGLEGALRAGVEHLRTVAPLVLAHRRRREPFEVPGMASGELESVLDEVLGRTAPDTSRPGEPPARPEAPVEAGEAEPPGTGDRASEPHLPGDGAGEAVRPGPQGEGAPDPRHSAGVTVDGRRLVLPRPARLPPRAGQAAGVGATGSGGGRGRQIGHVALSDPGQPLDATATAVAYAARTAGEHGEAPQALVPEDLRAPVRVEPRARLVILAVDTSGSIAGRRRLEAARAAVISLLGDAYRRRDRVAMVVFREESAEVVLRPTGSIEVARARLAELPSGGRTPLAAGLRQVTALVRGAGLSGGPEPVVVLVTDGRATAGGDDPVAASQLAAAELAATKVACLVVDAETGPARLGLARSLAETLSAGYVLLEEIERQGGTGALAGAIRARLAATAVEP
jgi:magnesium chelatase subunit D